jgi:hypothetical protein
VTVDPTTTNAACSMSDATTVHFDHAGTCVLAAHESSARTFVARAADPVTQSIVVPKTEQAVTIDSSAPADPTVDGSYAVSASSTSGRDVTLSVHAPTGACAVSGSTVSFHHVGTCVVTATQAGDADLARAAASQRLTVGQASQTISLSPEAQSSGRVGESYTAIGGDSGVPVVVTTTNSDVCSVTGSTVTLLNPGTCIIQASQGGNDDYQAAPDFTASIEVLVPIDVDLAVTAVKSTDISGLSGVTATVTGVPVGATATLTATADGTKAFHPDGVPDGVCATKVDKVSTTWTCSVSSDSPPFTFAVNTVKGRDVTFEVQPNVPLVDTNPLNNSSGVQWGA